MSPPPVRRKKPNAAVGVDRADQNNVQELLCTLSICGDVKQKFLDIVYGGMGMTPFDFWKQTNSLGRRLQKYSESLLDIAKSQVREASGRIEEVRQIIHKLITSANHLQTDIVSHLTDGVTIRSLSVALEDALLLIFEKLHEMFPGPDHAPHHDEREHAVRELLDKIGETIVAVGTKHGLGEAVLRKHIENINPLILKLVVLIVVLMISRSWVLRRILRIFGFGPEGPTEGLAASWFQRYFSRAAVKKDTSFLNLENPFMTVGFGPGGTVKDSATAWAQRYFYGAAVKKGS